MAADRLAGSPAHPRPVEDFIRCYRLVTVCFTSCYRFVTGLLLTPSKLNVHLLPYTTLPSNSGIYI